MEESFFTSCDGVTETGRRLAAFLEAERLNPSGEFSGYVKDGWLLVHRRRRIPFGFDYRGAILADTASGCARVELHITPSPLLALVGVPLVAAAFLYFVFFTMIFNFAFGIGGNLFFTVARIMSILVVAAILLAVMIEPRRTRRRLIAKLQSAGIARRA